MKNLLLVRHAKAEIPREYESDFSRPILKKGMKDAKKIAEKIKKRVAGRILFISSPANRTFETAHIFANKMNYPVVKIFLRDALYHNPVPEKFLEIVREFDDLYDTVILFGHNPSLSDFASYLMKDFEFDIPKSGVVAFGFHKDRWQDIEKHSGILEYAEYPVRKSEDVSAFENTLVVKISEAILNALENINPDAARNVLKSVARYSAKLAGNFTGTLEHHKADKKSCHKEDEKPEHDTDTRPGDEKVPCQCGEDKEAYRNGDEKTDIQQERADEKTDAGTGAESDKKNGHNACRKAERKSRKTGKKAKHGTEYKHDPEYASDDKAEQEQGVYINTNEETDTNEKKDQNHPGSEPGNITDEDASRGTDEQQAD